jgi:hypothetical protein
MMYRDTSAGEFAWRLRRPGVQLRAVQEWVHVRPEKHLSCLMACAFLTTQHTPSRPIEQKTGS